MNKYEKLNKVLNNILQLEQYSKCVRGCHLCKHCMFGECSGSCEINAKNFILDIITEIKQLEYFESKAEDVAPVKHVAWTKQWQNNGDRLECEK